MEKVLEIRGLTKRYKGFTLNDVSLEVPKGYIMGLIGPNGAGKTTIIKLIMNLIRRDAGEIRVFGMDNLACEPEIKSRIGFVYETPHFYDDVSLKDIKSAFAPFYEKWDEALFTRLAGEFGLPLKKKFKKLSHGMKMKFSLALALSHDADLLLLDEPTSGLDPVFRQGLLDRLAEFLQAERKSVLFSTHITSDLEKIADYITFVRNGETVFSSTKDDVRDNWGIVKAGREILDKKQIPALEGFRASEFGVEALTSDAKAARQRLRGAAVIEHATLDDIMFFTEKGDRRA
jgi:ABC-2 type transport system ATP-binding protein